MARQATSTRSNTIEYDHAPIPAEQAEMPDFGEPDGSPVTADGGEVHASFEAHDFGGREDR